MDYIYYIIITSFISGAFSGIFGIGGGLAIVPILNKVFQLMGVDDSISTYVAMGTSLGVIAPTSFMSFMEHRRHSEIDMKIVKDWVIVIPVTVIVTSIMVTHVDKSFLNKSFSIFCSLIGCLMLVKDRLCYKKSFPDNYLKYVWGVVIGFLSGALGVGGGLFCTILMLFYGSSIYKATAISSAVSVLISFPGVLVRIYSGWGVEGLPPLSIGFVNIGAIFFILPISILVTPFFTKLSYTIGKKYLSIGFSMLMFTTSFLFA